MKRKIDKKHIAFHVLVAVYFIWALIFCTLIGTAITAYSTGKLELANILGNWLLANLAMGSLLYIVIKMFRYKTRLLKGITVSYFVLATLSIIAQVIIRT